MIVAMKAALLVSLVAVGLAGASLVVALRGASAGAGTDEPSVEIPDTRPALQARLAALENEARDLRQRLEGLELRPVERVPVAPESAAPGWPADALSQADLDAFREELEASLAGASVPSVESEAFRATVAETLAEVRKSERAEKVGAYYEDRDERLAEDVAEIREWLDLSPAQTGAMEVALVTHYEREAEVYRRWMEGEEDGALGEQKRADGEAFYADLAGFLAPEQLETFWTEISNPGK